MVDNKKKGIPLDVTFDDLKKPETIISNINKAVNELDVQKKNRGLFKIQSANDWINQAKRTPIPKCLFAEFWHEGEICILFADSNLGKSILAVQIADSISKNKKIGGFKLETIKQQVLYFDFELSAKQFEVRYAEKNESLNILEILESTDGIVALLGCSSSPILSWLPYPRGPKKPFPQQRTAPEFNAYSNKNPKNKGSKIIGNYP